MIFVFGSRFYGKVDQVPGLGYVATRFAHIQFFPLLPMGSYLVFGEDDSNYQGVRIPLSGKSVLVAWLRAALFLVGIAVGLFAVIALADNDIADALWPGAICLAALVLYAFTKSAKGIGKATSTRAIQLAKCADIPEEALDNLTSQYGRYGIEQNDAVHQPSTRNHDLCHYAERYGGMR